MARSAEGWKLRGDDNEVKTVRFRHKGRRFELSTGERDPKKAAVQAANLYAQVISGRWRPQGLTVAKPGQPIDEVGVLWLDAIRNTIDRETWSTYEMYLGTHWTPFFETMDRFTNAGTADYTRMRLGKVIRGTVNKELSAMRGFAAWCFEAGVLLEPVVIASPPKKATGTRDTSRPHKSKPVEVAESDVRAFIDCLPEWSSGKSKKDTRRFRVRLALEFSYETGLRPETISELAWEDWLGARGLRIRKEIDKARYDRDLPLSPRAHAILLEMHAPNATGPIFGRHDYREYISVACTLAKIPRISPYDLRHGRGTHLTESSNNLPGVAFLLGHKNVTTTNRYVHPGRRAAEAVLAASGGGDAFGGLLGGDDPPAGSAQMTQVRGAKGGNRTPKPLRALEPEGTGWVSNVAKTGESGAQGSAPKRDSENAFGGRPPKRGAVRRLLREGVALALSGAPDAEQDVADRLRGLARIVHQTAPARRARRGS